MNAILPFPRAARTLAALALASASFSAFAQSNGSPWLPLPGGGAVTISDTTQSGDSAYVMGGMDVPISAITSGGASKYKRESIGLKLNYGISDSVAIDVGLNYSKAKVGAADSSSGLGDSTVGVNYRVLDEYERRGLPTITLRAAAILGGNYDGARLAAIGKDASGYELAVLIGKQLTPQFSVWGSVGFEARSRDVPNATFVDLNLGYSPISNLTLSAGYTTKKYGGSLDIAGPGFSPARFQQVNEERDTVRVGASYSFSGNQSVALQYGKLVRGRNTVRDDNILGLAYTFSF
jgi:Putative MetA-pathway of phenol degradation